MRDYAGIARRYAEDVVSGVIPACRWIKLACQRHLDDLAWQDREEFRYRFHVKKAAKACRFIELLPHTKGKWGAKRESIRLEPWQVFFVASVFGWVHKASKLRRFRRAVLIVPRKNGKSLIAAGVGLYMMLGDGEFGAEVYSGATNEKQAWEVFRPAKLMAQRTPDLLEHFAIEVNAQNLRRPEDESRFEPLIGKPGDGASPSCAIVDEYHEHETDHLVSTMETGMGAREQPLLLVITTAGDNISGPCYEMQTYLQKVLEGTVEGEDIFGLIYTVDPEEVDSWDEPALLAKANPNMGVSVFPEYLERQQRDAVVNARHAGRFKTKHLNVWVQARAAYFNVLRYQQCEDKGLRLADFAGQRCFIGVDLAEKRDLCAVEMVFEHRDGFARFGRFYLPEDVIEAPGNEKYMAWRDQGFLIDTDGNITDFRRIKDDILDLATRFEVEAVHFDPHHAMQTMIELREEGLNCLEFRQAPSMLSEPMRAMDALIMSGRLYHDGNPLYTWMLSNVVNKGKTQWHWPAKEREENKIDGPVATMLALGGWVRDEETGIVIPDDFEVTE